MHRPDLHAARWNIADVGRVKLSSALAGSSPHQPDQGCHCAGGQRNLLKLAALADWCSSSGAPAVKGQPTNYAS